MFSKKMYFDLKNQVKQVVKTSRQFGKLSSLLRQFVRVTLRKVTDTLSHPLTKTLCTVWGPVSGHKRRKHVFRTSEGLQSAEINTKSSFSIQEAGVKLTAASQFFYFVGPIVGQWGQFPVTNEEARFST